MDAVSMYVSMANDARMGEALTPSGDARCFTVSFPAHHDAAAFIRRAGGADMTRSGDYRSWRWTMPDGLYAVLVDGDSVITFTNSETGGEAYYAAGWRMEGGDR